MTNETPNHALIQLLEAALLHPESAEGNIRQVIEALVVSEHGVDLQSQLEQLRAENEALRKPRMFPIQRGVPVRWELAEKAYATYSGMFGTDQSLQRLAERGGFGVEEFACLYLGHDPRCKCSKACVVKVEAEIGYIARLESRLTQVEQERDDARANFTEQTKTLARERQFRTRAVQLCETKATDYEKEPTVAHVLRALAGALERL